MIENQVEETLKNMIDRDPGCLTRTNGMNRIPIFTAAYCPRKVRLVPLLAKKAIEHQCFSEESRGGLLLNDPIEITPMNVLQIVLAETNDDDHCSSTPAYLAALKDLVAGDLLREEDFRDYNLFYHACQSHCQPRLDYLLGLPYNRNALKDHTSSGRTIGQAVVEDGDCIDVFKTFLGASIKRHSGELGLLCQKNRSGKTLCESAFDEYGKKETFAAIGIAFLKFL